jgi:hypothetical protein
VENNVKNIEQFSQFESSILRITTDSKICVSQENLADLLLNKKAHSSKEEHFTKIEIMCCGYKIERCSPKIKWLRETLIELLSECVNYLNIVTVTEQSNIKEMEKKLSDSIVRNMQLKVPDELWVESEIMRQVESGQMRSIIPFYQYSFKPLAVKFIAREFETVTSALSKPSQIFSLKYWLTLEIAPSRSLKIKMVPFRHISLSS